MYHFQPPVKNERMEKDNVMKVTGDAEVAVRPDSASVNLGVISENKELISTQQENSMQTNNVVQSLLSLGVNQDDIQTVDYRIESNYDYVEGKQVFRGYKVTHLLKVKINDVSKIGTVVDQAVQNGANYVSNVEFTSGNQDLYYQQALVLALNKAIEKAKTIAGTLKVTLIPVPILVVEEGRNTVQPLHQQPELFSKAISTTQLEPGQIQVRANILAEFRYYPQQ